MVSAGGTHNQKVKLLAAERAQGRTLHGIIKTIADLTANICELSSRLRYIAFNVPTKDLPVSQGHDAKTGHDRHSHTEALAAIEDNLFTAIKLLNELEALFAHHLDGRPIA